VTTHADGTSFATGVVPLSGALTSEATGIDGVSAGQEVQQLVPQAVKFTGMRFAVHIRTGATVPVGTFAVVRATLWHGTDDDPTAVATTLNCTLPGITPAPPVGGYDAASCDLPAGVQFAVRDTGYIVISATTTGIPAATTLPLVATVSMSTG
jgi:hypothetical protein